MPEPLITILTVNYNTSDFIELILYALRKLTANAYKVSICDNGSTPADLAKLKLMADKSGNVELIFRQQNSSTTAHGEALDILIEKVNTKYTAILDSDCTFLIKHWDRRLIEYLDDKSKIVGSTSPQNRAGARVGGGGFPLPFAVLFETQAYKNLGIQCIPDDIEAGQDTCWQWEPKFTKAGYTGKTFITKNSRDFKQGPFASLTGIEQYYTEQGQLIASHFGRGATNGAAKYFQQLRIPLVTRCLKRYCGRLEKKEWMSRCRQIIDEQASPKEPAA